MTELPPYLATHAATAYAIGAAAALLVIQIVVADVLGILRRHEPGTPVPADHGNALFRAGRAYANTNETIAAFVLLVLFALMRGAEPQWLAIASWAWVATRAVHTASYYADWRLMRSVSFGFSLLALLAIGLTGLLG